MSRQLFALISLGAIASLCAGSAAANVDDSYEQLQDSMSEPVDPDEISERRLPLRLTVEEEIEWGNFDGDDVTSFRTAISARVGFPITKKFVASASAGFGYTATDFGGQNFINTRQGSGDPWDDFYEFSFELRGHYAFTDRWGLVMSGLTTSRFEAGASFADGQKGAGAVGASYRRGGLSLAAGVLVSSRVNDSGVSVNPFGLFSWKINDTHTLRSDGLGVQLRSRWCDSVTTFGYSGLRSKRWRLDDRNDGIVGKGSLRDRKVPIGVGVEWKFADGWRLGSELGLVAYRQLKVIDDDDDTFDTETANAPGVFGSLMLQYRF